MAYSFNVTAALQEYIAGRSAGQPFTKAMVRGIFSDSPPSCSNILVTSFTER